MAKIEGSTYGIPPKISLPNLFSCLSYANKTFRIVKYKKDMKRDKIWGALLGEHPAKRALQSKQCLIE